MNILRPLNRKELREWLFAHAAIILMAQVAYNASHHDENTPIGGVKYRTMPSAKRTRAYDRRWN